MNKFIENIVELLKKYKADKEKEGFVPTIEMLIEELELDIKKHE